MAERVIIETPSLIVFCDPGGTKASCVAFKKGPEHAHQVLFDLVEGTVRHSHLDAVTGELAVVEPQPEKVWSGTVDAVLIHGKSRVEGTEKMINVDIDVEPGPMEV